jgi:hypothetical protein
MRNKTDKAGNIDVGSWFSLVDELTYHAKMPAKGDICY